MADYDSRSIGRKATTDVETDAGLRKFMLGVYNKMGLGLLLTGALAYVAATVPAISEMMFRTNAAGNFAGYTILGYVISFAPVVILLGSSFIMRNPTVAMTTLLYWTVVALIGLSTGANFLLYTGGSLATTFFVTAATFGALSLYGYTTKKDLSAWGKFLFMAVIGLIIASVVNMFMQSGIFHLIISGVGVLIFSALIAFETQNLKSTYYQLGGNEAGMAMATNYGALSLYISFINLFQFLLAFIGIRRD
jgi:uncharacterized protein